MVADFSRGKTGEPATTAADFCLDVDTRTRSRFRRHEEPGPGAQRGKSLAGQAG